MFYKLNNKVITINPFNKIGSGFQGTVYHHGAKAIKIHKKLFRTDYAKERDEALSTISTKYVILPEDGVTTLHNKYCGYQMPYIDLKSDKKITDSTKKRSTLEYRSINRRCQYD